MKGVASRAKIRSMRRIAYLTDVEGRWDKLVDFCEATPLVTLDAAGSLRVADGARFVFGGDAVDRGSSGRKIVATLLAAKEAQPDSVVLIAGNRDINKLRLVRELDGHPPAKAPVEIRDGRRADLLRFIFSQTMGAREAFEHRRTELASEGRAADDEAVAQSYLDDLAPNGSLVRYLASAVLAHREGDTLFLHGGVTDENLGVVPGRTGRVTGVDAWVNELDDFYAQSMDDFAARRLSPTGEPMWSMLIAYQAPLSGSRLNQTSVVYARPTNDRGEPVLPSEAVVAELRASDVRRVIVGHTPSGDCPTLLRDGSGFELLLADNSYGRIERGSSITIDDRILAVAGETRLDSGEREGVGYELELGAASILGLREASSGRLVKARLRRGDYLTFRATEGHSPEQKAMSAEELSKSELVVPR